MKGTRFLVLFAIFSVFLSGCGFTNKSNTDSIINNKTQQDESQEGTTDDPQSGTLGLGFSLNDDAESYHVYDASNVTEEFVIVPQIYNGLPVTVIGAFSFEACINIKSVELPTTIKEIHEEAFSGCSSLISINIPNSVTFIGSYVFNSCSSLTSITLPDTIHEIEDGTFFDCSSLSSITIPDSITSIGESAFAYCSSLTSITIPNSVTSIGLSPFKGCSSLTSIFVDANNAMYDSRNNCNGLIQTSTNTLIAGCSTTIIPDSVTSIGDYAFEGCSFLTSIIIPDSITSIGESAFAYCSSLTSIIIPDSVRSIGSGAFSYCSSLTSIFVDANNAMYDSRNNCNGLIHTSTNTLIAGCSTTIIPDSVTSIGREAFSGRSSLTSITIPDSVTSIGRYAFSGCSSLTSITIPNSVKAIDIFAFYHCTSLTFVYVPESVSYIGSYSFEGCESLVEINYGGTMEQWSNINNYLRDLNCIVHCIDGDIENV